MRVEMTWAIMNGRVYDAGFGSGDGFDGLELDGEVVYQKKVGAG